MQQKNSAASYHQSWYQVIQNNLAVPQHLSVSILAELLSFKLKRKLKIVLYFQDLL